MTHWHEWTDEQIATWQQALTAVEEGDLTTLGELADQGFDFNQRGPNWTGAPYVARTVYRDDPPVSLIQVTIDQVEFVDDPAEIERQPQTLRFLLEHGASPNDSYLVRLTPLGHAVQMECEVHSTDGVLMDGRLVRPLLEAGADPLLPADNGQTALDHARRTKHESAVRLMEEDRRSPSGARTGMALLGLVLALAGAVSGVGAGASSAFLSGLILLVSAFLLRSRRKPTRALWKAALLVLGMSLLLASVTSGTLLVTFIGAAVFILGLEFDSNRRRTRARVVS